MTISAEEEWPASDCSKRVESFSRQDKRHFVRLMVGMDARPPFRMSTMMRKGEKNVYRIALFYYFRSLCVTFYAFV